MPKLFISYHKGHSLGSACFGNTVFEADEPKTEEEIRSFEERIKKRENWMMGLITILWWKLLED